ncbi:serine protease [Bacillus toyonensis]|uniref:S8 family peptidase n=1 Tax=Bacillus toyonensis TaxID=155322 RepID=UPI000BFB1906|nr:S8 family peptidase [Bacillus toyonensis]PHD59513.1 serine protease [Bacillus toyonensis]
MPNYRLIPYDMKLVSRREKEIPDGVSMIKAPDIWDDSDRGDGIVVAIMDTGCDNNHPDLRDRIIRGINVTSHGNKDDYSDIDGHGTHVAGTVAGNGNGIFGVAPKARLMIYRIFKPTSRGPRASNDDIRKAIDDCIEWNKNHNIQDQIRIINMSLGSPDDDQHLHDAIKKATDNEILVICAAGNEGSIRRGGDCSPLKDEYAYPAVYPEVISVGATTFEEQFECFTNTNLEVDLVAPGVGILSTYPLNLDDADSESPWEDKPGDGYAIMDGTSMAAPHVSGAAALIIKQCENDFGRTLTETEIYAQLIKRTVSLGVDRRIEGNGLLDLTEGYRTFPNRNQG